MLKRTFELIEGFPMKVKNLIAAAVLSLSTLSPHLVQAQSVLDLRTYKSQVEKNDPELKGIKAELSGIDDIQESPENITDTNLIASAATNDDQRPTQNPAFQGDRSRYQSYSFGLAKQTSFGPRVSLTQNYIKGQIENAAITAVPLPDYYDSYPKLEINVPLWRNFFGSQVRAEIAKGKAQLKSQKIQAEIQRVQSEGGIELTFHSHVAQQELLSIQNEILDRARKIYAWVKSRSNRGLVDNSDLYQAEAAVKLREIELEKAEKMLISSARHFNNLRGIQSDVVSEKLFTQELPMKDLLVNSAKAKISRERELGKVVSEIQEQTFITMRELSLPQMSLDFAGQWNGRDKEFQEAQTESMEGDQPYWYVGFQLSIPLDIPKYYRLSRGYSSLIESEKLHLSSLNRDQDAEWKSFVERGSRLYKQVSLFRQLEEIQKRKADAERTRLTNGRSTTFQVLSFEQDYIAAKSQRISSELEAWQYLKEIPLFN